MGFPTLTSSNHSIMANLIKKYVSPDNLRRYNALLLAYLDKLKQSLGSIFVSKSGDTMTGNLEIEDSFLVIDSKETDTEGKYLGLIFKRNGQEYARLYTSEYVYGLRYPYLYFTGEEGIRAEKFSTPSGGNGFLKANGTIDENEYVKTKGDNIISGQLRSMVETYAPFLVASSAVCPNLNADLLDGEHADAFVKQADLEKATVATATTAEQAHRFGIIADITPDNCKTIGDVKKRILEIIKTAPAGIGTCIKVQESLPLHWDNDSHPYEWGYQYTMMRLDPYQGDQYGRWVLATCGDRPLREVGLIDGQWQPMRQLLTTQEVSTLEARITTLEEKL